MVKVWCERGIGLKNKHLDKLQDRETIVQYTTRIPSRIRL
mgnify:FL=1